MSTDPSHIAQALRSHWSRVFSRKGTDQTLRLEWLADEAARFPAADRQHMPGVVVPFECFHVFLSS